MKKILFLLILFSLSSVNRLNAQEKLANTLLWEVVGPNQKDTAYIFGTIHMIDSDYFWISDSLQYTIESVDKIVYEIDMNEIGEMDNMLSLFSKLTMPSNMSLDKLVSDDDYELLDDYFAEMGLPLAFLKTIKPFFLNILADPSLMEMNEGEPSGSKSYEFELMKLAERENLSSGGLETLEIQMSIFDSIPYEAQAKMLVENVKSQQSGEDADGDNLDTEDLFKAYKEENLEYLNTLMRSESMGMDPEFTALFLDKRNQNWIPAIKEQMQKQKCLFAVGAGHLVGDMGILNLLLNEGYSIRPMQNQYNGTN